jgi:hypothetical protein
MLLTLAQIVPVGTNANADALHYMCQGAQLVPGERSTAWGTSYFRSSKTTICLKGDVCLKGEDVVHG